MFEIFQSYYFMSWIWSFLPILCKSTFPYSVFLTCCLVFLPQVVVSSSLTTQDDILLAQSLHSHLTGVWFQIKNALYMRTSRYSSTWFGLYQWYVLLRSRGRSSCMHTTFFLDEIKLEDLLQDRSQGTDVFSQRVNIRTDLNKNLEKQVVWTSNYLHKLFHCPDLRLVYHTVC